MHFCVWNVELVNEFRGPHPLYRILLEILPIDEELQNLSVKTHMKGFGNRNFLKSEHY